MKFINRTDELERLDRTASLPKSSLVVIWGRRRMGKTRLLLEWVKKHQGIYWVADESSSSVQRHYFAQVLGEKIPGFADVLYPDWKTLLNRLAREAKSLNWRGPIVIDELPYLALAAPEFPSVLQAFIDHEAKASKLIIAVSGSSQRRMQDAVLSQSAPLFGRANELIKLEAMEPKFLGNALGIKSAINIIEAYSVYGGVPLYWELANDLQEPLEVSADKLILDPKGPLHDEPSRLLLEELPNAISLKPILDAIGLGARRLSEIAGRLEQPSTSLSRPIIRLQELGLIGRETPFGASIKESKRALYKISDPFLRFWFSAVAPQKSLLAQLTPSQRKKWFQHKLTEAAAQTWEDLCRASVPKLTDALGAQFGIAARFWHGKGPEWDVVAKEFQGEGLMIGEAKWLSKFPSKKYVESLVEELIRKGAPPIKRKAPSPSLYILFLSKKPKEKVALPESVKIIDAADVIGLGP